MQFSDLKIDTVPMSGGVDMVTPPQVIKPGRCIFAQNFEPGINGGYVRMAGIERFDGRSRPSQAQYMVIEGLIVGPLVVGDNISFTDSGATAVVAAIIDEDHFVLANISGTLIAHEAFTVGGELYGYIDEVQPFNNGGEPELHAEYKSAAADAIRGFITSVPGSGPVRGVKYWRGDVYAFRNTEDGTQCKMYKSSASGWQEVTFLREIQFTGAVGEITDGAVINGGTSLATAIVRRAILRTGTWTASGAGTLVVEVTSGTFQNAEAIKILAVTKVTAASADTAITLDPDGKFEFDIGNFYGNAANERMYFVDGKNYIHEWDGTYLSPIRTGVGNDNPKYIAIHKKQLIVAIESEIIVSGIGAQYSFTALTGAAQIATGETITGLKAQVGDANAGALVVLSNRKVYILYGNDVSDYNLVPHSPDAGGVDYSLQNIGFAHYWDTRGLSQLMASQAFGSFQSHILTQAVQPYVDQKAGMVNTTCVSRKNNLYKIFFNDGSGLNIQIQPNANSNSPVIGDVMPFNYGDRIANVSDSSVGSDGIERKFIGCADGYVYETDVGTSLDGDNISAFLILAFNDSKSSEYQKNYKRCKLLFDAGVTAHLDVTYDLSFGDMDASYGANTSFVVTGGGGYWDTANWDSLFWDAAYSKKVTIDTPGNGRSISLVISNDSKVDESFEIEFMKIQYTIGRILRGD